MGLDYSFNLGIGFEFSEEDVIRDIGKVTPEISHMEDRFDPKTGKSLGQVKVIDQKARTLIVFDGIEYSSIRELYYENESRYEILLSTDYSDNNSILISAKMPKPNSTRQHAGNISYSGDYNYHDVIGMKQSLDDLKKDLLDIGLHPKEAVTKICVNVN